MTKESACNSGAARYTGSIPGLGRSPGGGHGNPLQYSCLENPGDRRAWRATVLKVTKSQTYDWVTTHAHTIFKISTHRWLGQLSKIRKSHPKPGLLRLEGASKPPESLAKMQILVLYVWTGVQEGEFLTGSQFVSNLRREALNEIFIMSHEALDEQQKDRNSVWQQNCSSRWKLLHSNFLNLI